MDDKMKSTIDKVIQLSRQNAEFGAELRKRLGMTTATMDISVNDERLDRIYEYCIEKVVRRQAQEFYKDFPISSIVNDLVNDFCRMESFRRKDNFGDFCLALYQQLENIINKLCLHPDLNEITERMWNIGAYIVCGKDITPAIDKRCGRTIATFIFGDAAEEKTEKSLQSLSAKDKIRIIIYFLGYKTMITYNDYNNYKNLTSLLNNVYLCRNTNHRGNDSTLLEVEKFFSQKAVYYFKFLGALTQFVEQVKSGWVAMSDLKAYALTLPTKKVAIKLNVVGKIDLVDDGRKRFK